MDGKNFSTLSICQCPICVPPINHLPFALNVLPIDHWDEFKRNGVDKEYVENWSITGRTQAAVKKPVKTVPGFCVFCKNNERPESEYKSHRVRNDFGVCECPILREYKCPVCNKVGGDKGHTIKYCPQNKINRAKEILKASGSSLASSTEIYPRKRLSPIGDPVKVYYE